MSIEFVRIPQPCFPPVYRYKYTVNGQELGYYSRKELEIMKEGAESDLRHFEGWMDKRSSTMCGSCWRPSTGRWMMRQREGIKKEGEAEWASPSLCPQRQARNPVSLRMPDIRHYTAAQRLLSIPFS